MDKVKRVKEDLKTRRLISKEEQILKRMREEKDFDDSLIDLTLSIPRGKHSGSDAIVDARYDEIEKMFLDDMYKTATATPDSEKAAVIEEKAKQADREVTRRMKECYLNPDYMKASQKARESRQKMIEMLEERGITVDESYEF